MTLSLRSLGMMTSAHWVCPDCSFDDLVVTMIQILNRGDEAVEVSVKTFNQMPGSSSALILSDSMKIPPNSSATYKPSEVIKGGSWLEMTATGPIYPAGRTIQEFPSDKFPQNTFPVVVFPLQFYPVADD